MSGFPRSDPFNIPLSQKGAASGVAQLDANANVLLSELGNVTTTPYDALVASLNPEAWWKLADAVGSTTALDSSGNGYTGTVNGGVTFGEPGAISGTPSDTAALFDGTTGRITTSYEPLGNVVTISAFYRASSTPTSTAIIFDTGAAGSSNGFDVYMNASGKLIAQIMDLAIFDPTASNDGKWHMATVVANGTAGYLYRDGELVASGTFAGSATANYGLAIGSYGGGPADFFPGDIQEVSIFPTALTASQVLALYNAAPKYGEQNNHYVTNPAVTSGTAFTPSTASPTNVTFQINAASAGSYTLTMGSSTGTEITLGSAVAVAAGNDVLVTISVPRSYRVVLTLTTVTLASTTVLTNPLS